MNQLNSVAQEMAVKHGGRKAEIHPASLSMASASLISSSVNPPASCVDKVTSTVL